MRGDSQDHWGCGVTKDEKRLRKQCKKLYKWCRKHGIERVDIYVNATDGFGHAFVPDGGPSYFGRVADE